MIAKVEKYIPDLRRCHNCQKYGLLKEACTRKPVCMKCGSHEPDHTEENCLNSNNLNESHWDNSIHCKIWGKEREI